MKKIFAFFLSVIVCSSCLAQEEYKDPSPATMAYHTYRKYTTTPPYGLEKVRELIKKKTVRKADQDDDSGTDSLPTRLYASLSLREKFTYNMIYGESYSQNCDAGWVYPDEEKKIYGNLPDLFGEQSWGQRQISFFKDNKDSVIALMTESIGRARRVGLNYKYVIVQINATSMIPLLIDIYNLQKKDNDILTVLMLLMRNNQYPPFIQSISYQKLYAGKEPYYMGSLVFNEANEALIIQRATDFYNGLSK
jgi:hypothetical protein